MLGRSRLPKGDVAYKLQLPEGARIHDVFHVGVLKPFHGEPPAAIPPLPPLQHGRLLHAPEHVLKTQLCRGIWHVLIKWTDMQTPKPHGNRLTRSKLLIQHSSSRTSFFPREGEMSWSVEYMREGNVARLRCIESPRSFSMSLNSVISVSCNSVLYMKH